MSSFVRSTTHDEPRPNTRNWRRARHHHVGSDIETESGGTRSPRTRFSDSLRDVWSDRTEQMRDVFQLHSSGGSATIAVVMLLATAVFLTAPFLAPGLGSSAVAAGLSFTMAVLTGVWAAVEIGNVLGTRQERKVVGAT